jgi:hypothetical protein
MVALPNEWATAAFSRREADKALLASSKPCWTASRVAVVLDQLMKEAVDRDYRSCAREELEYLQSLLSPPSPRSPAPLWRPSPIPIIPSPSSCHTRLAAARMCSPAFSGSGVEIARPANRHRQPCRRRQPPRHRDRRQIRAGRLHPAARRHAAHHHRRSRRACITIPSATSRRSV